MAGEVLKVSVKWGKQSYDVEIDTSLPASAFKAQLMSLTGVPVERQKVMVKGGMLKDDAEWAKTGVKQGSRLMMMGTADKVVEAPKEEMVFLEDLPPEQAAHSAVKKYGMGLTNLGNTCYMNSCLQCLYSAKGLRAALASYEPAGGGLDHQLTSHLKGLFRQIEGASAPVQPMAFLSTLRQSFPQFAEMQQGMPMQHDAEECWSVVVNTLTGKLKGDAASIDALLGVGLKTELVSEETGESIVTEKLEHKLICNITSEVNHLHEGIRLGLKDDRQQTSAKTGAMTTFRGSSRITRLPQYLTVQELRFFFKAEAQQKAKILRKVALSVSLDLHEFCTPELQAELAAPRDAYKAVLDARVAQKKGAKGDEGAKGEGAGEGHDAKRAKGDEGAAGSGMDVDGDKGDKGDKGDGAGPSKSWESHVGKMTGRFDLTAVLTHKGRSADSGHYVAWVKQDDGTWVEFDDDNMILRKDEDIVNLSGGGDWHMAYMLLYTAQTVPAE
ncbi:unnamed protein product [Pedinophyceae sp. YPF-701]|nr:unnamed protein product [Pedinophyceae sp. YPF-701]